ncbi:hypothetical protein V1527DRAFT_487154 [Lipomyces starkeyi]
MARIAASDIILPRTQAGVVSKLQSPDSLPDSVQSYRSVTKSPTNIEIVSDSAAALFSSARINGFCGGLGQSLFWCFARMDLSSAVIGEELTIIKLQDWSPPGMSLNAAGELFRAQPSYDMYANYAPDDGKQFDAEWEMLWNELRIWVEQRPVELKPLLSFDEENNAPFPTNLYGQQVRSGVFASMH